MRNVIIELNRIFGVEHNTKITNFINLQYSFASASDGVEFTLRDVDEYKIIGVLKDICTEHQLSIDELINGFMLVPAMNRSKTEFSVVAELRSALLQSLFEPQFTARAELIKDGDSFEYYGKDRHIVSTKATKRGNGSITAGFINGTLESGPQVSIFMDREEMSGVRHAYTTIKYNGACPLDEEIWNEVLMSSVYRRMQTEPMTELILAGCTDNAERISKLLAHGSDAFFKSNEDSDVVLSSWGKPIAKKILIFKAGDEKKLIEAQNDNLGKLSNKQLRVVVNNNDLPKTITSQPAAKSEDVSDEWGMY
jgi:hypothetical protein